MWNGGEKLKKNQSTLLKFFYTKYGLVCEIRNLVSTGSQR